MPSADFTIAWQAASNGAGARRWYVVRNGGREVVSDERGNYRRFSSHTAADRAASALNAVQVSA